MTKEEIKTKRERLDMEIIGLVDLLSKMVKRYAQEIGEDRPMTISVSARTHEPYISSIGYVNLTYCEEQGIPMEKAHKIPELYNVTRLSDGEIFHCSLGKGVGFLGEEDEKNETV